MRKILAAVAVVALCGLGGCQTGAGAEAASPSSQVSSSSANASYQVSNLADKASVAEVTAALKTALPAADVEKFMGLVKDYNDTIQNTSLTSGFQTKAPEYDMAAISELWQKSKGTFVGTDCRINTFTLLKDTIESRASGSDGTLLFMDLEAIQDGKLFDGPDTEKFQQLFSRIPTESTKDVKVHAQKMREHFASFDFGSKASMVSVVIHDTLEGSYLFVGHVGVLVADQGGYLFLEKLTFEEPYQALKFQTKEACFQYLLGKYSAYTDEHSAKPFIMENGELAAS